jgi:hypothetical protein
MIGWYLGGLAALIGGGGIFAILAATGGLPALAGVLALVRFFPSPRTLWRFFTSPPGLCVLVAVSWLVLGAVCYRNAERAITARYEQRIAESIAANKAFDEKLREETAAKAREQEAVADERVRAAEQRVVEYEQKFKSCEVGAAADWLNDDDGGVRDQGRAIAKPPQPPRRP